jgi:hypothetical protein
MSFRDQIAAFALFLLSIWDPLSLNQAWIISNWVPLPAIRQETPRNPYVLVLSGDIPDGMAVTFVSADMPPADAYIDEKKLTLEWDIAISQAVNSGPICGISACFGKTAVG